jgi:hypothetical protein
MKVVQEMNGRSSITLTSDAYTSFLPGEARGRPEAAALPAAASLLVPW